MARAGKWRSRAGRLKSRQRRVANGKTKPTRLRLDLQRWLTERGEEAARRRFIAIVLDAEGRLVERSPVDTGYFRASWGIQIGGAPPAATERRPEGWASDGGVGATTQRVAEMRASLGSVRLGVVVWLYNPVVYGPALEHGHSAQAPTGMVKITFHELDAELRARGGP